TARDQFNSPSFIYIGGVPLVMEGSKPSFIKTGQPGMHLLNEDRQHMIAIKRLVRVGSEVTERLIDGRGCRFGDIDVQANPDNHPTGACQISADPQQYACDFPAINLKVIGPFESCPMAATAGYRPSNHDRHC